MFSVYFFVIFFAKFCGNFCIEYFSAIFCVKNVIFMYVENFSPKNGQNFSKKFAIVNIIVKFCDFFSMCIIFFIFLSKNLRKNMRKRYQKFLRLQIIPQFFAEFFAIVNFTVKFYVFFFQRIYFFQIFKQKLTKK